MNCLFCGASSALTQEHLVSRPVADAFGIDRKGSLASGDAGVVDRVVTLDQVSVKLPCGPCNNGWMHDLENAMPAVARWMRSKENGIAAETVGQLDRWLLKSYIVLSALAGGIRQFGRSDDFSMVPEATRARRLRDGAADAFNGVAVGYARRRQPSGNNFLYAFGNPTVLPVGPQYANARSAGVAVFVLGVFEAWIVVPVLPAAVALPTGLKPLRAGATFRSLGRRDRFPDIAEAVVNHGEHDWIELSESLKTLVSQGESGSSE